MKTITPDEQSADQLQPVADYCAENRGAMADLVRAYGRLCGRADEKTVRRQVEQWLDSDEDRRVQPSLGAGLLLLRAFGLVKKNRKGR